MADGAKQVSPRVAATSSESKRVALCFAGVVGLTPPWCADFGIVVENPDE
ncbi:hypothetical protein [Lentzea flava]|uniref:Uncharacterized protein n=1 Tax=Lentzea flava TaxID=103732 RepID=A0ABQ2UAH9_9PSEU|nr:hypothetical protein [Lentzea flava]MCP2196690.1 hypothetical protein [Lentzea flava]GGU16216.1 hypothetical protein GCM10010178_04820 [Lentzea flava]